MSERLKHTKWQQDSPFSWTYRSLWQVENEHGTVYTKNRVEGSVLHYHDGTFRTFLGKDPHPQSQHCTKEEAWVAVENRLRNSQSKKRN